MADQDRAQRAPQDRAQKAARDDADLELIKKAESVLAEIDRAGGLDDHQADVLAALRIRIEGGPRKSLDELMNAAGEIRGKKVAEVDERLRRAAQERSGDLGDLLAKEPKKGKSLDDLLGS